MVTEPRRTRPLAELEIIFPIQSDRFLIHFRFTLALNALQSSLQGHGVDLGASLVLVFKTIGA